MRILLDESVPWRLGRLLTGHETTSVQRHGWASIKNGKLLAMTGAEFDMLLTADNGMEYQQNQDKLPVEVLIVLARSNRMEDLTVAVPAILKALEEMKPRTFCRVAA